MGITEYEELSFQILSKLHWYMWPLPVRWDYKASKLEFIKPVRKSIPFAICVIYIWIFGWSFLGTTIYVGYIHQRNGFQKITWAIFISCWIICTSFCLVLYLGYRSADAILSTFNELLEVADDICKEYPDKERDRREKKKNSSFYHFVLAAFVIPAASSMPFIITTSAILSNLDCPHFILEEIMEDSKDLNGRIIIFKLVFRYATVLVLDLEIFRTLTFGLCCFLIVLRRTYLTTKCLLVNVRNFEGFLKYYIRLCLLFKKVENIFFICVYMILSISFWGLVVSCWVCVKLDPKEITIPIYGIFVVITVALLIGHYFVLPMLCQATDISELIVKVHMLRAKFAWSRRPFRRYLANIKRVQATVPYRLKYGVYGFLNKAFLPGYFDSIVERVFDAILIK